MDINVFFFSDIFLRLTYESKSKNYVSHSHKCLIVIIFIICHGVLVDVG